MTAKELYSLKNTTNEGEFGTFHEFISEFEEKWLQYSDADTKVKAYFGSVEKGFELFEKWKMGYELFGDEKKIAFPEPFRFSDK